MFETLDTIKRDWVEEHFAQMTTEEKLGQMICERHPDLKKVEDLETWCNKYPIGSLFVGAEIIDPFAKQADGESVIVKTINDTGKIPLLLCGDFEWGIGDNIKGFTRLPNMMALGATRDPELAFQYGQVIAEEASYLDIRWSLSPVADVNMNRENPVTNIRSVSDNPDLIIELLKSEIKGMQAGGCAACLKHFPGDGSDNRNQHYVTSFNVLSKEEWDGNHGKVFKQLIDAGAMSVMIGHIAFPDYEPMNEDKGKFRPATTSYRLMTELLREELGFKGIIVTDALCMAGFHVWAEYRERMLDAFNAGTDIFLWPETEKFYELMIPALHDGRASMDRLNESVRRILSFKALLGLDGSCEPKVKEIPHSVLQTNSDVAEKVAAQSITLLRNNNNNLPLKLNPGARVLMLVTPEKEVAMRPLEEFANEFIARGYEVTFAKFSDFRTWEKTVDIFDLVMLLCNASPRYVEHRGFNMAIWPFVSNVKMKQTVVISFGSPYFLYDVAADTYVNAYSDSPASIKMTVQSLFGEIPFQGRSPVSVENCFAFGDGIITK